MSNPNFHSDMSPESGGEEFLDYLRKVVEPAMVVAEAEELLGGNKTRPQSDTQRELRWYGQDEFARLQGLIEDGTLADPRLEACVKTRLHEYRNHYNHSQRSGDQLPFNF